MINCKAKATPEQQERAKHQPPTPDPLRREPTPREIREWNENSHYYDNERR